MSVDFVDYTLLKKRGLIKMREGVQQQRFNFGQDGFVDLGNLSANVPAQAAPVPNPDYSLPTHSMPPVSEQATIATPQMAAVPDFLSVLAQANASSPSLETPKEPTSYRSSSTDSRLDDLSRTLQILVDRVSEIDIKISKLSGNFK